MGGPRRRPARGRTGQERRPAAAGRARAGQRRRGRRRPGAVQPEPHARRRHHVDPAVRRMRRHRALGHRHRRRVREDPRAVRPPDRTVPGHQAQVRRHDRRDRARHRRGLGRRPRDRRGARRQRRRTARIEFAAAVAATLAPVAAQHCTQDCIQVHGGIGFTWEHDTNVYYRRAIVLAACFGRAADYPQQVVDTATTTGMRSIDIDLDPDTEKLREEIRAEVAALKAIPREERNTAIAEGGWVQPHLPKPWGRAAAPIEQIIIAQEFSAGRVKRPQMGIAAWIIPSIVAYGTDEQQQRFLPPTFRGEMIWCQLFSEPGAGSDLASLTTKATKVDGGWRITGQKIWTTGAQYSQWGALLARTNPTPRSTTASPTSCSTWTARASRSSRCASSPATRCSTPSSSTTSSSPTRWCSARWTAAGRSAATRSPTSGCRSAAASRRSWRAWTSSCEFLRDGHFDQIEQNEAGRLIAEGHAAKLLNLRSTLLTLAGGDPMPAAAISKLLSMKTGQGYAEFGVSTFGTDGAIGDQERAVRQVGRVPARRPRDDDLRRHHRSAAEHHRRAAAGPAPRPVSRVRPASANVGPYADPWPEGMRESVDQSSGRDPCRVRIVGIVVEFGLRPWSSRVTPASGRPRCGGRGGQARERGFSRAVGAGGARPSPYWPMARWPICWAGSTTRPSRICRTHSGLRWTERCCGWTPTASPRITARCRGLHVGDREPRAQVSRSARDRRPAVAGPLQPERHLVRHPATRRAGGSARHRPHRCRRRDAASWLHLPGPDVVQRITLVR